MREAVFGGVELARARALELVERGAKAIIAVTACIPGLSGDDLSGVKAEVEALGCPMYIVPADGVEAGDYNQGMALCYRVLAQEAVEKDVLPDPDAINLVYEHTISAQTDRSYQMIEEILQRLGLHVNCRFVCNTTISAIRNFLRAPYSVLARDNRQGEDIRQFFEETYGCKFLPGILPKGFSETAAWVELVGSRYGRQEQAQRVIQAYGREYRERIRRLKPYFQGKKAIVFLNKAGHSWVLPLVEDLQMDVVETFLLGASNDENASWNNRFSAYWSDARASLEEAALKHRPDIILFNDPSALADIECGAALIQIGRDTPYGFWTGVEAAERWVRCLDPVPEGGWKNDKAVFEQHYS